jgi:hypothetical protein
LTFYAAAAIGAALVGPAAWGQDYVWEPLGSGMSSGVVALTVYNGELIAGGLFTTAGGVTCNYVARYMAVTGACCFANGSCAMLSPAKCAAAGGTPGPAGSNCTPNECPPCVGDLNCDGQIDFRDINPFVLYLSKFTVWQDQYPGCNALNGDINGDGVYGQGSFRDINPFVTLLCSAPLPIPCD